MNLLAAIELHLPRGFTIQEQLGKGATSTVYLARCAATGARLVVKVMRPGTVTTASVDRFLREMQTLRKLEHPRIIPILEPGEANGAFFFTMPYRDGVTLRARLQASGPLTVRESLLVARDVNDALGHAHAKGIVHRDVKPENILLADGGAYLMDFGFANTAETPPNGGAPKNAYFIVGTPDYVSPEQVTGKQASDWRSDFFSLGCVMYEMLTGTTPFAAGSPRATMMRRLAQSPPDVRSLRPGVPDDVASIIRCNLELYPSARFATAGFLRVALDAALERLDQT
jgi:eukaryotic-like serine/threonine-protein kinase